MLPEEILEKQKNTEIAQNQIDEIIKNYWKGNVGLDGIGKIKSYWDKDFDDIRVSWCLKEPVFRTNDNDEPYSYRERFTEAADAKGWKNTTFGTIAKTSYGLIKSFRKGTYIPLSDLLPLTLDGSAPYVYDDGDDLYPLDKIAIINVNKRNNGSKSDDGFINAEYAKPDVKKILLQQIDYIEPEIIIVANNVKKMAEDLSGVKLEEFEEYKFEIPCKFKTLYHYNKETKKLIFFTHHPSMICTVGGIEPYYKSIVSTAAKILL